MLTRYMESTVKFVKQELERRYPGRKVHFKNVQKNNGTILMGVIILAEEETISPTIYIDEFLARGCSVDEICNEVCRIYEKSRVRGTLETDLADFNAVCGRICFKLVNAKMNENMLKGIPHRRQHDLAVVYYILMDNQPDGLATIPINQQLAACWGVDEETLFNHAAENTRKLLHIVVMPMDMIFSGYQPDGEEQGFTVIKAEDFRMTIRKNAELNVYVLSNETKTFGAAAMLYKDVLRRISQFLLSDLYILPSSIHEVLIITDNGEINGNELLQMVCAVNQNDVSPEEFLADNVYRFDREIDDVMALC